VRADMDTLGPLTFLDLDRDLVAGATR
jgi:hypothetical protein